MKSEEFIREAGLVSKVGRGIKNAILPTANLGFGYEKPDYPGAAGTAKGVLGRLASNLVGAENYGATAEYFGAKGHPKTDAATDAATDDPTKSQPPSQSKFHQQFELIDDDPVTIQYKNNTFQRDQYGKWIDFRTGKEVPDRFSAVLDKISPPKSTHSPTATELPLMSPPKTKTQTTPAPEPTTSPTATDLPHGAIQKPNTQQLPTWQPPTDGPDVWTIRGKKPTATSQPASPEPAPAPQAKARLTRNNDGSILVVDKMGKQWSKVKPESGDYWTDGTGLFRPGSAEYEKLNNFVQNLKESLGRKRR